MEILGYLILALSILLVLGEFLSIRKRSKEGAIYIVPPLFAGIVIFALCILLVLILGLSPFHLLWMLPVSFVVALVLIVIPFFQWLFMALMFFLFTAGKRGEETDEAEPLQEKKTKEKKKRKKK